METLHHMSRLYTAWERLITRLHTAWEISGTRLYTAWEEELSFR